VNTMRNQGSASLVATKMAPLSGLDPVPDFLSAVFELGSGIAPRKLVVENDIQK
jgi:hypothetical protein